LYKKIARKNTDIFAGKGLDYGELLIRLEATGFGGIYFVVDILKEKGLNIEGKIIVVSGLEMSQNAMHLQWTKEEVDAKLHQIMNNIHE
jgi:glutamate dehydrogenase/leucine dehydrogenase